MPEMRAKPVTVTRQQDARKQRLKAVPIELDKMADAVLNYRPKNKAKSLRPKKRKKAKVVIPNENL